MSRAALSLFFAVSGVPIIVSESQGRLAGALDADENCQGGSGLQGCASATSLLQVQAAAAGAGMAAAAAEGAGATAAEKIQSHRQGERQAEARATPSGKLAMVHVPCNFGHTIEVVGLGVPSAKAVLQAGWSFHETQLREQWRHIRAAAGPEAEFWGQMNPDLRVLSNTTGCDMYYTPQHLWPEALAASYLGNKTVFGMLRNPYDRVVNEFRMQLMVYSSFFSGETRADVSRREGHLEKEQEPYTTWYKTCDVNAWIKVELAKFKSGDKFRGNCHLLPQAEFFRGPYGISLAVDVTTFPSSFNRAMKEHGYEMHTTSEPGHNDKCAVSAWSLDEEAVSLIQEVYAEDFELNCKHLGICDVHAKSCVCEVADMCGDAPADACAKPF